MINNFHKSFVEEGVDTSDATMVAADLLLAKTGYGSAGTKITGTAALREAIAHNYLDVNASNTQFHASAPISYIVETPAGVRYWIYVGTAIDVWFKKSTDGLNWGPRVAIHVGTAIISGVWYDRWSGINADKIHVAYTESVGHTCKYRSIDAGNSDALSTETTIFTGVSAGTSSRLSIARMRGGNLLCWVTIDANLEGGMFKSTDVGANWSAVTNNEALATHDHGIILPGFAADDQDAILLFWDASANEISRCLYDDSGDSWAETSIAGSMMEVALNAMGPSISAFVDLENSQIVMSAWSGVDTASAALRCWTVTESAITEKTAIVASSTDDQGLCAIGKDIDTGHWRAFYGGLTDGTDTWSSSVSICSKISTDSGATWGSETIVSGSQKATSLFGIVTVPRFSSPWQVIWQQTVASDSTAAGFLTARGAS